MSTKKNSEKEIKNKEIMRKDDFSTGTNGGGQIILQEGYEILGRCSAAPKSIFGFARWEIKVMEDCIRYGYNKDLTEEEREESREGKKIAKEMILHIARLADDFVDLMIQLRNAGAISDEEWEKRDKSIFIDWIRDKNY